MQIDTHVIIFFYFLYKRGNKTHCHPFPRICNTKKKYILIITNKMCNYIYTFLLSVQHDLKCKKIIFSKVAYFFFF